MTTIIFDFDDTIFDTARLKETLFSKLESFDIARNVVEEAYLASKKEATFRAQVACLIETGANLNLEELLAWLSSLPFSSYVASETHKILTSLGKDYKLILLTKGDEEYQNMKIKGSGLAPYFKEIHIVPDLKEEYLKNMKFEGPVYFVNDKESENEVIQKEFPEFKIFSSLEEFISNTQ